MLKSIVVLCSLLLIAPSTLAAKITTTEDLVQAMQKKYAKSWYKTATFVQKTTNIDQDGNKKVEMWYEAMSRRQSRDYRRVFRVAPERRAR